MRRGKRLYLAPVGLLLLTAAVVMGTAASAVADPGEALEFRVLESDGTHTVVEVALPGFAAGKVTLAGAEYDAVSMAGAAPLGGLGEPLLAVAGTLIAVPPTSGVELRVLEEEHQVLHGYRLVPVQDEGWVEGTAPAFSQAAYSTDGFLCPDAVAVGEPAIMRDYRVVPLRVYPFAYNPVTGDLRVATRLKVELDYSRPGLVNVLTDSRAPSGAFRPLYEGAIANYEAVRSRYENDQRGKYLIITHDNYYNSIRPLAAWKHKSGYEVEIAKLSVIGSTSAAIKTYIQNAYNNWVVRPEYILLVGDTELLPTSTSLDDYYAQLAGTDYLIDVQIGRISCDSVGECDLIVAKTMGYEHTPYMNTTDWFKAACLIVRQDYDPPDDAIYFGDTWHARNLMLAAGFGTIDTLFQRNGGNAAAVHAAVTAGRVLVNYRGQGVSNWWSPFDVNPSLTNPGYKLPVINSATCGTGSFNSDGYPCETWMRAGTIAAPKGSVAYVATSRVASGAAHLRSACNRGFYTGLFSMNLSTVSGALINGKLQVFVLYANQSEYTGWNVQGDPGLDIWTGVPKTLVVTHPAAVPPSPSTLNVEVTSGGSPVNKALVCAYAPGEVYVVGSTNTSGQVSLSINPATSDTVWITVSGHNLRPYESYAVVTPTGPYLTFESLSIDDAAGGNGDGLMSPGETIDLDVTLRNVGPDPAQGVTSVLRSGDSYMALIDSTAAYGTIMDGGTKTNTDPLVFGVADGCPNGHGLAATLHVQDSASRGTWEIVLPGLTVSAADLIHDGTLVVDDGDGGDGDGVLESGETAWLEITLANEGPIGLLAVSGDLSTADAYVAVTDPDAWFGSIPASGSATASTDRFRVSVSPAAPPSHGVQFTIAATGIAPTYAHAENVPFTLTLGGPTTQEPTGPCAYGYYAYDDTDTWTGRAPVYEWVEIVPPGPGTIVTAITNSDAAVTTLALPFTFKYFGLNYTTISACSNGFLAMGTSDYRFGDNSSIPDSHGPAAMIAPMWDDLDPSSSGDIYTWSDTANHRWIIQFDAVPHYGGVNPETFEVIIYDPAYYPTASGDGEIVMLYQTVGAPSSCTTGIESHTQTDGIRYLYNGAYDSHAAALANGRALKFTTQPPLAPSVWLAVEGHVVDDEVGGDGDGHAEPSETIDLIVSLRNNGTGTASSVSATITTSDPDVTIGTGTSAFGTIPGGQVGSNSGAPFQLTVSASPADELVELDIHIFTGSRYDTWDVITLVLDLATGVPEPAVFALRQNAPNPFSAGTVIAFELPAPAHASLEVYNVAGRRVATVLEEDLSAGPHSAAWDGRDSSGRTVPAGIYFCRLEAGQQRSVQKMIVVR